MTPGSATPSTQTLDREIARGQPGPVPRPRHCPWCGTALPERTGAGRPRETCGKARCRRLNAAHHRREADHARRLADQKALTAQAIRQFDEFSAHVARRIDGIADGIQETRRQLARRHSIGPGEQYRLLVQTMREQAEPRLRDLADYARARPAETAASEGV